MAVNEHRHKKGRQTPDTTLNKCNSHLSGLQPRKASWLAKQVQPQGPQPLKACNSTAKKACIAKATIKGLMDTTAIEGLQCYSLESLQQEPEGLEHAQVAATVFWTHQAVGHFFRYIILFGI